MVNRNFDKLDIAYLHWATPKAFPFKAGPKASAAETNRARARVLAIFIVCVCVCVFVECLLPIVEFCILCVDLDDGGRRLEHAHHSADVNESIHHAFLCVV